MGYFCFRHSNKGMVQHGGDRLIRNYKPVPVRARDRYAKDILLTPNISTVLHKCIISELQEYKASEIVSWYKILDSTGKLQALSESLENGEHALLMDSLVYFRVPSSGDEYYINSEFNTVAYDSEYGLENRIGKYNILLRQKYGNPVKYERVPKTGTIFYISDLNHPTGDKVQCSLPEVTVPLNVFTHAEETHPLPEEVRRRIFKSGQNGRELSYDIHFDRKPEPDEHPLFHILWNLFYEEDRKEAEKILAGYGLILNDEDREVVEKMMTMQQVMEKRYMESGFGKGYEAGFSEGKTDGIEEGRKAGRREGRKEGYKKGRKAGILEEMLRTYQLLVETGLFIDDEILNKVLDNRSVEIQRAFVSQLKESAK